jgi:hypothetical protein
LVLLLAAIGVLTGVRRGLFLLGGFFGGLVPAVASHGAFASSHRMITAFAFVSLAAGCALDLVRRCRLRAAACAIAIALAATQSVGLYFSPGFWPPDSRDKFDWERTELVEALPSPPHPRFIVMREMGYYFGPRSSVDPDYEFLGVDNWLPPDGKAAIYVFSWYAGELRQFYEDLFGVERVQSFGRAFMARFEAADWSWLLRHGWTYEIRCGEESERTMHVLTLSHNKFGLSQFSCSEPITHTWRGRWLGPPSRLQLRFSGKAEVEGPAGRLAEKEGYETAVEFEVERDSDLTIRVRTAPPSAAVLAVIRELTQFGPRLPAWDRVLPLPAESAAAATGETAGGQQ